LAKSLFGPAVAVAEGSLNGSPEIETVSALAATGHSARKTAGNATVDLNAVRRK
jgi:hypothetical protein